MTKNLKNKAINGTLWSALDNILNKGVAFIVGIILANLLTPAEYGLIAIIMLFIAVFNSLVDSGFSSALIRKNNVTELDYNTIFLFNLAISIVLFIVLYLISPFISQFFRQPELTLLTRVMGVIVIINALAIIQRTKLVKSIDFRIQTKISVVSSVISGGIGITMAFLDFGVWSLVGQQISRQLLNSSLLWFYNRWCPKLEFSKRSFQEMFSFGWRLMVSGLIDTIWKEIYQIVIGRFYSSATLGQYGRAQQFNTIFSSNLTQIIQRVSFPVLSSIQDDPKKLKEAYRKIIKTTMYVSFICMLILAAIAKPLILVLIGEKWLQSVEFLQIICFSGMMYPLHAINLNMLQVQGRSDLFLRLEIFKKIIALIPVLLGIFISIYWMLIGSVFSGFCAYYLNSYYSGKLINYSIREQIIDIYPSFLIAIAVSSVLYLISFADLGMIYILIIQLLVGIILTICFSMVSRNQEFTTLKTILLSVINRNK
ncbi:MAG: lipopolysaccharide biosynthesis protein [bacterium]